VPDALVIGGGLAGASVAISLARAGRDVLLLEKSAAAHHKVCGEFLSHEALHYLASLGLDLKALGAVPIESVRLAQQQVIATARLPFPSLSLSRARLDEALLALAAHSAVTVLRRRRVQSLESNTHGWTAQTDTGEVYAGRHAFLSTGKHDLYGWNRPPGRQNDLLAFKMYWQLSPSQQAGLDRHVELILFPGGYAGLQPVEDGHANLCLLVRRAAFRSIGGSWPALLAHMQAHSAHLAMRLNQATPCWERPLSVSAIPYGYVRDETQDGLWRLHSARLAAAMFEQGSSPSDYQTRLACDVSRQVGLATLLSQSLVHPQLSRLLSSAARLWPGVLAHVATSTRIRAENLVR
jgi:hypothetical protein